jgi:hypothetical protein
MSVSTPTARLGQVLYRVGCGLSILSMVLASAALIFGSSDWRYLTSSVALLLAGSAWLVGRACRYVLAGT